MCNRLGPYELNSIVTGDARELAKAIPDESVDLIFTDPVYDRIEDYEWLAETAARVLKPDRACLVWCSIQYMAKAQNIFSEFINFIWWFSYSVVGGGTRLLGYNIFTKWTPLIWCSKGKKYPVERLVDARAFPLGISRLPDSRNHKWTKHPEIIAYYLKPFTGPDDIIFDPFTGGGTVPAVCKMLNRQYLAFEIDPETADLARRRVTNTQPPLPIEWPEQLQLV